MVLLQRAYNRTRRLPIQLAGIKLLLGKDPKKEYKDKVAEVELTD